MGLLEKIRIYSYCTYISDLKYSCRWKTGIGRIFYGDDIRKYSLREWRDALEYLQGKDIPIEEYEDVVIEIDNLLKSN